MAGSTHLFFHPEIKINVDGVGVTGKEVPGAPSFFVVTLLKFS